MINPDSICAKCGNTVQAWGKDFHVAKCEELGITWHPGVVRGPITKCDRFTRSVAKTVARWFE